MIHYTLDELTRTDTGLSNIPNADQVDALVHLVDEVLDPARTALGVPITVTSGFRNEQVNRRVGGVSDSQHLKGEAADLTCTDNAALFEYILNNLPYDQLIWERGNMQKPLWVHVSLKRRGINRRQVLYYNGATYTTPAWLTSKKKVTP